MEQIIEKDGKRYKVIEEIKPIAVDASIAWVRIPETEYEVTLEVLHKNKTYKECQDLTPEGCEIIDLEMIGKIVKNLELKKKLKMDGSSTNDDFYFQQPFPEKNINRVARFYADSDGCDLDCDWGADYSGSNRGVRFVRKISKGSKKK
jgi:hypothetical protein